MTIDPVRNFGKVTVFAGYDSLATSIVLNTGDGSKLPDPFLEGAFNLIWWNFTDYPDPSDDPYIEVVRCTARSIDTLTISRAQESTYASNKNAIGKTYKMILAPTKKTIDDLQKFSISTNQADFSTQSFTNLLKNGNFESWSGGITQSPDGWVLEAGTILKSSDTKIGSYSASCTSQSLSIRQDIPISTTSVGGGGKVTFGAWIKSLSNRTTISIHVNGLNASSAWHSGSGNWEFLAITRIVTETSGNIEARLYPAGIFGPPDVTANIDGAILVEGSLVPAFSPKPLIDDGKTITIDSINNLVGIGQINPSTRFHVEGGFGNPLDDPAYSSYLLGRFKNIGTGNQAYVEIRAQDSAQAGLLIKSNQHPGTSGWGLLTNNTGDLRIGYDSGITALKDGLAGLTLLTNGNIGIGTSNPTNKLDVNGRTSTVGLINTERIISMADVDGSSLMLQSDFTKVPYYSPGQVTNAVLQISANRTGVIAALNGTESYYIYEGFDASITPVRTFYVTGTGQLYLAHKSGTIGLDIGSNLPFTGKRLRILGYTSSTGIDAGIEIGDGGNVYWRFARDNTNNFRMDLSGTLGIMGGNIGIGTTNPQQLLDIYATTSPSLRLSTAAHFAEITEYLGYAGNDSGGLLFKARNGGTGSSDTIMTIQGGYNYVGIGTTNPLGTLHVNRSSLGIYSVISDASQGTDLKNWYIEGTGSGSIAISAGNDGITDGRQAIKIERTGFTPTKISIVNGDFVIGGYGGGGNHLGIRNTIPAYSLDVNGIAEFTTRFQREGIDILRLGISGKSHEFKHFNNADGTIFYDDIGNPLLYIGPRNSNGNVGIGTTNPNSKLYIYASSTLGDQAGIQVSDGVTTTVGIALQTPSSAQIPYIFGNTVLAFGASGNERMRIDSGGNIGIGTNSPSFRLHLQGSDNTGMMVEEIAGDITTTNRYTRGLYIRSGDRSVNFGITGSTYNDPNYQNMAWMETAGKIAFAAGGSNVKHLTIDTTGNVGIGTTNPQKHLEIGYPGEIRLGGVDFVGGGMNQDVFEIRKSSTGSIAMLIDTNIGRVGIGTTSPEQKLSVDGNIITPIGSYWIGRFNDGAAARIRLSNGGYSGQFYPYTNGNDPWVWYYEDWTTEMFRLHPNIGNGTDATLVFTGTNAIFNSNVGIGTASPNSKLEVNGDITVASGSGIQLHSGTTTTNGDYLLHMVDGGAFPIRLALTDDPGVHRHFQVGYYTNDDRSLAFNTALDVDSYSGNVGIGTISPNTLLELNKNPGTIAELLRLNNPSGGGEGTKITFYQNTTEVGRIANFNDGIKWNMRIGSYSNPETLTITQYGNIGIGTTNPTSRLDVEGDIELNGFYLRNARIARYGDFTFITEDTPGNVQGLRIIGDSGIGASTTEFRQWNFSTGLGTTGNIVLLRDGGNIGIGTTTPDNKLDVNGKLEVGEGPRGCLLQSSYNDNFQLFTFSNTPNPNWQIGYGNGTGGLDTTREYIYSNGGNFSFINSSIILDNNRWIYLRDNTGVGRGLISANPSNDTLIDTRNLSSWLFTANIAPLSNNTYDIGQSATRWKSLYITDIRFPDGTTQTTAAVPGYSPITTITVTTSLTTAQYTVLCDASLGAITVNLPTAVGNSGKLYNIKKIDNSTNIVTIDPSGTEQIEWADTRILGTRGESITFQSDNSNWYII